MSVSYGGDSIVFADGSVNASGFIGHRNRIINGAMMIDQRNAGALVTTASINPFTVDRFQAVSSPASKFTAQQNSSSVTPPIGFLNYLGIVSTSAYSSAAGDQIYILQSLEGYNTADLGFGTANASTVTLSFRVYSSLTGTFGGALRNYAGTRSYPFTYSVASANTWTTITITIAGDTSGTWVGASNAGSMIVFFNLGSGSTYQGTAGAWAAADYRSATGATSVVGTNGATFYITGVQLERGSTASSFEYRSYGAELALCQRYYEKSYPIEVVPGTGVSNGEYCFWYGYGANSAGSSTNAIECWTNNVFKVQKRASVTVVTYDLAGNSGQASRYYTGVSPAGNVANTVNLQSQVGWKNTVAAGNAANGFLLNWTASAEL